MGPKMGPKARPKKSAAIHRAERVQLILAAIKENPPESVKFGILTIEFQAAKYETVKLATLTNISCLTQPKLWKVTTYFQAMTDFEA